MLRLEPPELLHVRRLLGDLAVPAGKCEETALDAIELAEADSVSGDQRANYIERLGRKRQVVRERVDLRHDVAETAHVTYVQSLHLNTKDTPKSEERQRRSYVMLTRTSDRHTRIVIWGDVRAQRRSRIMDRSTWWSPAGDGLMPTSGTHLTIVQRLAAERAYTGLLGNPDPMLDESNPEAIKMRFACLGAVGPDLFYALGDYGGEIQDLENVLVKIAATFTSVGDLMGDVSRYVTGVEDNLTLGLVSSITETTQLVTGVMNESVLALVASGVNLWTVLEPARQKDLPRERWYWADYFHYIRSGRFASTLLRRSKGNAFHHAYALGYLTHYVTDVVGHPYVNQFVGAPWRLAWQRHHLVENFMDAYVWDRWHSPLPKPAPPSADEQPLDQLVMRPNVIGMGAPMTFARINDWIKIGSTAGNDPIDMIVQDVCAKIKAGLLTSAWSTRSTEWHQRTLTSSRGRRSWRSRSPRPTRGRSPRRI